MTGCKKYKKKCKKNNNRFQAFAAIIHATGARPSEIKKENGVHIKVLETEFLVKIKSSKHDDSQKGQKYRYLYIKKDSISGNFLKGYIDENEINEIYNFDFGDDVSIDAFAKAYKRAAIKALGTTKGKKISLYSVRHQIAANLKKAGFDKEQIALALGHQSDRSQEHYGHWGQGGAGGGLVKAEGTNKVRMHSAEVEPDPGPAPR